VFASQPNFHSLLFAAAWCTDQGCGRNSPYFALDKDRLPLTHQHNQPLASGHPGVKQVPLQHWIVLGQDGDDDGWILWALLFLWMVVA
jgi:hypothetical protein